MLRIGSIVWGVRDLTGALRFWSAALGYRPLRAPDPDWVILVPRSGVGPQLALKCVTSTAQTHQRHHLDLYAADRETEVARLLDLGAKHVSWRYEAEADYIVLEDPEGNRFCVIQKGPELFLEAGGHPDSD